LRAFKIILVLTGVALFWSAPAIAQAIGIDLSGLPKVKEYESVPQAQFETTTKPIKEEKPYNDPRLTYELRIPKEWTDNVQAPPAGLDTGKQLLGDNVLVILGRYIAPPKNFERSYITVEAQEMGYEISAQNWFVNFILNNGYSLSALSEKSEREIEALYVHVDKDQTFVVRARVIINGPRLTMIRYYLPQTNYDEEKIEQAQIISTFKLNHEREKTIEKHLEYGFLDQSYFNYPASWNLREKSVLSIERMYALLYQERKDGKASVLDGHIKITVISRLLKTTLPQEIEKFRDDLNIPDYKLGNLIENIEYKYDPSIKNGKAQIYKLVPAAAPRMKDYEFAVAAMEGEDYFYITSLITPSREQDFYMWARNLEAFKVVNQSIRRSNKLPEPDPNDPYFDYLKEAQ